MNFVLRCLVVASLVCSLFAIEALAMISEQTRQAATSLGAANLGEVEFVTGSDQLTDQGRAEIRNVIDEARQKGELDYINVLAWSDQEYPAAKTTQSKAEISLAKRRIEHLQAFLKNDLKIKNTPGFNMAERPGKIKEFFGTKEARVKKTTEVAGAAPVQESETGLFGEKGQASKAVLMIFTKK
ncbi:hypothetical protein CIK05_12120 [Bdellovibrio sp. qaytius]|nr:hypothetical protein CIK05_12120 [Bdellovibrio sp. qaytius]